MKKTLHIISFAAVALALLSSCAKEQFKENAIPAGEPIEVSLNGLIGEFTPADATKATAESVVRVTWGEGDKVFVYDGSNASIGTLTVTPDENNASYAMLSGTITASAASPAPSKLTLVYVKGATEAPAISGGKISVDLSNQNQAEVPFVLYTTVDYNAAALTKTNEYISFTFATSVMTVNCTGLQTNAGSKIDVTKAEIDGVSTACELTIDGSGVTAVAGTTLGKITRIGTSVFQQSDSRGSFRLALAADPDAPAARNILVHQGNKVSGSPFTSATLAAGKSYNTVYQMGEYISDTPAGILSGGFTVNASGKKVHFSQGNLYWDGDSFELETNQYDFQSSWNASHVSYFFWSKTASIAYAESYNDGSATVSDVLFTNATDETTKPDFTVNGVAGKYRALSIAEWQYLLIHRTNADDKVGFATVNGIAGVIVLPDTFTDPMKNNGSGAFVPKSTQLYTANVYTTGGDWEAMESAGAVFLPAAGRYNDREVSRVGDSGSYLSSSAYHGDTYFDEQFSSCVAFDGGDVRSDVYGGRNYGYCVRLVTESSGGYAPAVKVTGISLNKTKTTIEAGATERLDATVAPADATNKQVNWSSSDTSVATVDANSGEVTGVAEGSAVITVDGNFTAVCLVTVVQLSLSLPGEFTINSDGDKIHFAKGNLYCSRTSSSSNDWTWHFYDEQYQYNNSYTQTNTYGELIAAASDTQIDLFTWGYDSEKSINPVGTDYVTGYATDGATFSKSEDWGYVFGGNSSHWRTLTKDEWEYIISTRTGAGDKLGFATIGTVKGLVILPDSFTLPAGCTFISKSVDPYYENTYTQGDSGTWKAMENAGAVFLPAVGRRLYGSELNNRGDICRYWSSSAKDGTNSYVLLANYKNEIQTFDSERFNGFSVRLVKQ